MGILGSSEESMSDGLGDVGEQVFSGSGEGIESLGRGTDFSGSVAFLGSVMVEGLC